MDIHQELSSLLGDCAWVNSPGEALRRVPALASELPAMVRLPGKSKKQIPITDMDEMVETVVRTLVSASSRVLSGGLGDRVDQLSEDDLAQDPMVQLLEKQFAQLGCPGLRRDVVPLLATCWVSSRVLGGRVGELRLKDLSLVRQAEKVADRLLGLEAQERGDALTGLSWELSGRLSAALGKVQSSGRGLRNTGLARTLLPSRLLMGFPRGSLDQELDLPLVSAVLGLGLNEHLLSRLERVAGLALSASKQRVSSQKPTGVDLALSQALDRRLDPEQAGRALLHTVAGPLLVGSIPALLSRKQLKAAGLEKSLIASLQDPVSMGALGAAWHDLVAALAEWDVLSVLVDRVRPLFRDGAEWRHGDKALEDGARWRSLLPRSDTEETFVVVSARFTDVRETVDQRARETGRHHSSGVVEHAWTAFCESRSCAVHDWAGDHGVAAFDDPLLALGFAREVSDAFSGPYELPIGARGGSITVRAGLNVGVGISSGKLVGGSDGCLSSLRGPAVGTAMAMAGTGMLEGAAEEAGGYRRSVNGRTGLRSEGIVMGPEYLESLCDSQEALGTVIRGPVKPGEDGREFEFFPVLCWWSTPMGSVVAMGLERGERGGRAAELVDMDEAAFQAFCDADRVAGRMERGSRVRDQARWEGFGGEVVEQSTDDIDAVFLGKPSEADPEGIPGVFAPDPIAVIARDGPKEPWPEEVIGAPMLLEDPEKDESGQGKGAVELPGPAVFIDDDWDTDGWEENSWEDESWGESGLGEAAVTPPAKEAVRSSIGILVDSYVVVRAAGCFYFGRLDGPSLRDAFQCETAGDTLAAYKSLLVHHQKMQQGYERAQILGVQEDWHPESLDKRLLEKAAAELKW